MKRWRIMIYSYCFPAHHQHHDSSCLCQFGDQRHVRGRPGRVVVAIARAKCAEDVEDIYESIEKDARNSGNIVITKEAIEQRSFPFWTMGFKRLTRSDIDHLPGFSSFLDKRMTAGELAASEKVIGLLYHLKEDNLR